MTRNAYTIHPWMLESRTQNYRTTPASPCPVCYAEGSTSDTGDMQTWRCPRNHQWIASKRQTELHGAWVGRYCVGTAQ